MLRADRIIIPGPPASGPFLCTEAVLKLSKALRYYDRRYKVPEVAGTRARLCIRCDKWFAAASRERICYGCSDARERVKRAVKAVTPGRPNEPANKQVSGGALSHSLALEAALRIDFPNVKRWLSEPVKPERRCPLVNLTDAGLIRAHKRAVSEGLQGCLCRGDR